MNIDEYSEERLKEIKRAFTIYIIKVIKHSSIDFARKEKLYNSRFISLNEYMNNEMSLSNFDNDIFFNEKNKEDIEEVIINEKHKKAILKLSKREKQIIDLIYIKEKSVDQVSKILNINEKTVLNTKQNALNKLRKDMKNDVYGEKNIK